VEVAWDSLVLLRGPEYVIHICFFTLQIHRLYSINKVRIPLVQFVCFGSSLYLFLDMSWGKLIMWNGENKLTEHVRLRHFSFSLFLSCKIFFGKPEWKISLGRPRRGWKDSIVTGGSMQDVSFLLADISQLQLSSTIGSPITLNSNSAIIVALRQHRYSRASQQDPTGPVTYLRGSSVLRAPFFGCGCVAESLCIVLRMIRQLKSAVEMDGFKLKVVSAYYLHKMRKRHNRRYGAHPRVAP
jgi:hypothetical protein